MKFVRFGPRGAEKPGLIDATGTIRDLSAHTDDFDGSTIGPENLRHLASIDPTALPAVSEDVRLGSPISRIGHFIAVGLNYADHAAEAGMPIPSEPLLFSKAPSSLCGPNDDVILPAGVEKGDWEVELAIVIGSHAYNISEADALSCVAGFTICNDVSERDWQLTGTGQWLKGKSAPTFGPLGPWLVTTDDVSDPQALSMFLDVNDERMQTGNTATMVFTVAQCIAYTSKLMALEPGDVIITGTPPGVGLGMKPPRFLKAGDKMHLGIEGLGKQRQTVVAGA